MPPDQSGVCAVAKMTVLCQNSGDSNQILEQVISMTETNVDSSAENVEVQIRQHVIIHYVVETDAT